MLDGLHLMIKFDHNISPIGDKNTLIQTNRALPPHQNNILTSVENIINTRPNKKSSGMDTVLKTFSPTIILFVCTIFNHMLATGYFPDCWKTALVSAIPKPSKNSKILANWRPISQLCCLSKILEKIINTRILGITKTLPIFNDQFGFLAGHSTEHALGRIQNEINNGLNNGKITSFVALDLKAAFDMVWHDGLISKIIKLGINPFLCKIIKSFLKGRGFSVKLGGFITNRFNMENGSPQGSVISPTLFNLYVHDIPKHNHIRMNQFADDISLHF